jgi:cobalamin-dependent methionine synthase I
VLDHLQAGQLSASFRESASQARYGLDRMKGIHRTHRLAITIGFAAALTFTIAQPVSAACTTKEFYTNAALATAGHLNNLSRLETRDEYMKSAYSSLAKAQAQKCTNQATSDRWSVADSWLGVYAARDRVAKSQRITQQSCRSLQVAEAREGLALSWLELVHVQVRLMHTPLFQHALSALRDTARALSVQVPPLTASRTATNSYVKASAEARAHSSQACSDAPVASE